MILNGAEIFSEQAASKIKIYPFKSENVGPNSYDVTLGKTLFKILPNELRNTMDGLQGFIDPMVEQKYNEINMDHDGIILEPGRLYLGHTVEEIGSEHYVPMLEGRSSVGRMGLFIHVTAGFGDIGFQSQWTLELTTILPIRIFPGMRIGQVFFYQCTSQSLMYHGRYQKQDGPMESLFWKSN